MISFDDIDGQVVLAYSSEQSGPSWLDDKLDSEGAATLSHIFTVCKEDLVGRIGQDELDSFDDEDVRRFVIGTVDDEYRTLRKDVLGLKQDLLIAGSIGICQRTFIAERNISIFRRIDDLVDEQIVVGGPRVGAIPEDEFARLLHDFPTSTEVKHYARTRITRVLREYLDTMSDAESRLAAYVERRERSGLGERAKTHGRVHVASELELEKFTYVRGRLAEMLDDAEGYLEDDWQTAVADLFLLVFPQYVAVLHKVHVTEKYSKESKTTNRYIDLMLVGADGHVDIIEIKRPRTRDLVSSGVYRGNHVPARELSGSIMQAEKYLFYLSKSGQDGERKITTKHRASLPAGLDVRITNPKAIILAGRDNNLSTQERFDFEFARRQYSNVVDVISYDDLLRRLDNVITALTKRVGAMDHPETDDQIGVSA